MHEIDQTKFRLYEINKIDNCFINDNNQQKAYSKKLSMYVTIFDYIDKILIVLSATSGVISIISFTNTTGAPVGIASANFPLIFCITTGIIKKLLDITRQKKKKHDKILMLAESKFNSIETLMSQALGDLDYKPWRIYYDFEWKRQTYNLISENVDEKQETIKLNNI